MRKKITRATVKNAKPREGKTVYLWDTDQVGFGLRVTATGAKSYVFSYSLVGWRSPRRMTIGRATDMTLDEARRRARELREQVATGVDPAVVVQEQREAPTMADLAERFLSEHVATKSASTRRNYRMLWDLYLLPALGRRKVEEVRWEDIATLHRSMKATPYQANRMLAVASKAFSLATRWGWWPRSVPNPARDHDRYAEQRRGQALEKAQLRGIGEALAEDAGEASSAAAVAVCLLSGLRPKEVREMRWGDLEEGGRILRLPESKTGPRTAYLGRPAAAIVEARPRVEGNEHVFPGRVEGAALADFKAIWRRIKDRAELPDSVRLYDAGRHTFTTWALEAGVPLERVKLLIGHSSTDITSRYTHIRASVLLEDADRVSGALYEALWPQEAAMREAV